VALGAFENGDYAIHHVRQSPHQEFDAAVKDGTAGAKLKRIFDAIKPEAMYFTALHGVRTAIVVVDLPDASLQRRRCFLGLNVGSPLVGGPSPE